MKIFYLLLSLVAFSQVKGQTFNQSIGLSYGHGAIIPEYTNVTSVVDHISHSFCFNWQRQTYGKSNWEKLYNYPDFGMQLQFQTLGNKRVNGEELSVVPYSKVHFLKDRKWNLDFQFGVGLSYVNRSYDASKNPENVAIGSHINAHLNVQLLAEFPLGKSYSIITGIAFDHLSNANLQEPNLGINSSSLKFGISRKIGTQKEIIDSPDDITEKKERFSILPSFGGKHIRALDAHFYFVASLTTDYNCFIRKRFHLAVGLDAFYDSSTPAELGVPADKNFDKSKYFETGIHVTEALRYKHFVFALQEGIYVGLLEPVDHHVIYSRAFIEYHFSQRFFCRLAMKSHLHILEFPEFGVGIKLGTK